MDDREQPSLDDIRSLVDRFDEELRMSKGIRAWADAQLRRLAPIFPERRRPKKWQGLPDTDVNQTRQRAVSDAPKAEYNG